MAAEPYALAPSVYYCPLRVFKVFNTPLNSIMGFLDRFRDSMEV